LTASRPTKRLTEHVDRRQVPDGPTAPPAVGKQGSESMRRRFPGKAIRELLPLLSVARHRSGGLAPPGSKLRGHLRRQPLGIITIQNGKRMDGAADVDVFRSSNGKIQSSTATPRETVSFAQLGVALEHRGSDRRARRWAPLGDTARSARTRSKSFQGSVFVRPGTARLVLNRSCLPRPGGRLERGIAVDSAVIVDHADR